MASVKPIKAFAGLRAASHTGDFIIEVARPGFVNVAGIQSPGLTAAPAIAKMVVGMLSKHIELEPKKDYEPRRKGIVKLRDNLGAAGELIRGDERYGSVLCTCRLVSEAEVLEAIRRGARTVDGVKFRTGLGMGECQGSYCVPKLLKLMSRALGLGESEVLLSREGSRLVLKDV